MAAERHHINGVDGSFDGSDSVGIQFNSCDMWVCVCARACVKIYTFFRLAADRNDETTIAAAYYGKHNMHLNAPINSVDMKSAVTEDMAARVCMCVCSFCRIFWARFFVCTTYA